MSIFNTLYDWFSPPAYASGGAVPSPQPGVDPSKQAVSQQSAPSPDASKIYGYIDGKPYNFAGDWLSGAPTSKTSSTGTGVKFQTQGTSTPTPQGQNNVPSQSDIDKQINDAFSSGNSYLDQLTKSTQTEGDTAYANLQDAYTGMKTDLTNTGKQGDTRYANLFDTSAHQQASAAAEALRAFNSQRQNYMARFGGGMGLGEGAQEIARQEWYRSQGKVADNYATANNNIRAQQAQFTDWFTAEQRKLEEQNRASKANISMQFQAKMDSIAGKRYEMEASRSQAKMQAMQDAINSSRQIEATRIAAVNDLDAWRMKFAISLGQSNPISTQAAIPDNIYTPNATGVTIPNTNNTQASANPYATNPYAKKPEDQFSLDYLLA